MKKGQSRETGNWVHKTKSNKAKTQRYMYLTPLLFHIPNLSPYINLLNTYGFLTSDPCPLLRCVPVPEGVCSRDSYGIIDGVKCLFCPEKIPCNEGKKSVF
jgi:hypothetical protein